MGDERTRKLQRQARHDPQALTALLKDHLRRAPPCRHCGGSGQVPSPSMLRLHRKTLVGGLCRDCAATGSLCAGRLALAAYSGSLEASEALRGSPGRPARPTRVYSWLRGLSRWSAWPYVAGLRVALACARTAVTIAAHRGDWRQSRTDRSRAGLNRIEDLLREPTEERGRALDLLREQGGPVLVPGWVYGLERATYLWFYGLQRGESLTERSCWPLETLDTWVELTGQASSEYLESAATFIGPEGIWANGTRALRDWALEDAWTNA